MLDTLLILFLSFVPMLLYSLIFWWFDRYEKEPLALLVAAFLWGAIPSIILALILEIVLGLPMEILMQPSLLTDLVGASIIAPLAEEGVKGLALLILLLFVRREIDSPLDGLIYGGIVGFGFAAVENVFYLFGAYAQEGVGGALILAFLRAGLFGLNHAMYTAFAGLGIALSLEIKQKWARPVLILAGFSLAVLAHALHNAFATFAAQMGLVPLLAALLSDWFGVLVIFVAAIWSFFLERKRIGNYAQALVEIETIPQEEIAVLKSTFLRRLARLKVLAGGKVELWWKMNRYHHKVTEAAFAWHRMQQGDPKAQANLMRLEQQFQTLRRDLAPDGRSMVH